MKQDAIYLQYKLDSVEDELKVVKVNKDEQRIRALDLKHELSEVSGRGHQVRYLYIPTQAFYNHV